MKLEIHWTSDQFRLKLVANTDFERAALAQIAGKPITGTASATELLFKVAGALFVPGKIDPEPPDTSAPAAPATPPPPAPVKPAKAKAKPAAALPEIAPTAPPPTAEQPSEPSAPVPAATPAQASDPSDSPMHPDPAVEPPPGFPKSAIEVLPHAQFVGCTPDFAVKEWNLAMGRGGIDSKGQPIRSFRHHLAAAWAYARSRESEGASGSAGKPATVFELKESLKIKEEELKKMRSEHAYEKPGGGFVWDKPENLEAAKVIKSDIAGLKARIVAAVEAKT